MQNWHGNEYLRVRKSVIYNKLFKSTTPATIIFKKLVATHVTVTSLVVQTVKCLSPIEKIINMLFSLTSF